MISSITIELPKRIEFGTGKIQKLGEYLESFQKAFMLVDPPIRKRFDKLATQLNEKNVDTLISSEVVPEPSFEDLEKILEKTSSFKPDVVVGVGGGSAMDLAKIISILHSGSQTARDIVGIDKVKERKTALVTVATTSGTGSEVTPIAVLTDKKEKLKMGIVSRHLIADLAVVDPELTVSMPSMVSASTGMDAMTHCIEAFSNRFCHPFVDTFALEGIRLIGQNLEKVLVDPEDLDARSAMSLASLYGGMCLGPVNTAGVHAMAYPLGGEYKVSHGVSNSVLLPFVMKFNLPECIDKYSQIGMALSLEDGGDKEHIARKAIIKIRTLARNCGIPENLKILNIPKKAIPEMAESALKVTRLMENNKRKIDLDAAVEIFTNAYDGSLFD